MITAWFTGADLAEEIARQGIDPYYNAISWHCMLAGYGNFPDQSRLGPPGPERVDMGAIDRFIAGCALNFPTHAEALGRMREAA